MPPQFIVLHTTEGRDSRAFLTTTPGSGVSCHRLIRTGERIYKILPDDVVAWTQGPARVGAFGTWGRLNMNDVSLSIELEHLSIAAMAYPTDVIAKTAAQCLSWWSEYGLIPIVYHWQIQSNKSDPPAWPYERFQHELLAGLRYALK